MTIIQAIILGLIQGITEFLPISSSAHLVLIPSILNWHIPEETIFPFDVLVQLGTLVAVIFYFREDLWQIFIEVISGIRNKNPFETDYAKLGWLIILATIPAAITGVLIKELVEQTFNSTLATSIFLFFTAAILFFSERLAKTEKKLTVLTWVDALIIGFFQIFAVFPGISRSGMTIAGGLFRKINRKDAARFSFLMSLPVMIGAAVFSIPDLLQVPDLTSFLPMLFIGFSTAMLTGYISIRWLLKFLTDHGFMGFSVYCVIAGCIGIITSLV